MILYFSATGNSLAVARLLAERLNERLMLLTEAVQQDWTAEKRIGLVFPSYDFNLPPALPDMISRLKISPQSYVFTVVTCGSAAGNCIWTLRRLLLKKSIELAYSHKVSMPDNSALAFGRNPNKQLGKLDRVPAVVLACVSVRWRTSAWRTTKLSPVTIVQCVSRAFMLVRNKPSARTVNRHAKKVNTVILKSN